MDSEFPEQFKCPICFEIPEKEIYQCENGHTICDICVKSLSLCPQCNVIFGTKNIRNRALESLLDMMKFNCSFKSEGCSIMVTRKDISRHTEDCKFGGEKVLLCKYLGYQCSFKVTTRNLHESLQHLKQEHSILSVNDHIFDMKIPNFKSIDPKLKTIWKPGLLNVYLNHYLLIVHSHKEHISIIFIQIGGNTSSNIEAKFHVPPANSEFPALTWTMKPIPSSRCESSLKYPVLLVSRESLLKGYMFNKVLSITVEISDKTSNIISSQVGAELDSFLVLPTFEVNQVDRSLKPNGVSLKDMIVALATEYGKTCSDVNTCNACRITPIRGPTYKCLQCADYDLCSGCMANNEHSFHHFTFLCTYKQVSTYYNAVSRINPKRSYVDSNIKKNLGNGYMHGSINSDAKNLRCQKCENVTDFVCLQCAGPHGLCGFCFMDEFKLHCKDHFFVITIKNSARQFALHVLRKHGILSHLRHELQN